MPLCRRATLPCSLASRSLSSSYPWWEPLSPVNHKIPIFGSRYREAGSHGSSFVDHSVPEQTNRESGPASSQRNGSSTQAVTKNSLEAAHASRTQLSLRRAPTATPTHPPLRAEEQARLPLQKNCRGEIQLSREREKSPLTRRSSGLKRLSSSSA